MTVSEFRQVLQDHPDRSLRIELADGAALAPHFHVTEVGCVAKDFVDCGGVRRREARCVLQTLVADDVEHRLSTTRLAKIVASVDKLDLPADAPVEFEHQERAVSTDALASFESTEGTLVLRLRPKQTACLAEDACGIAPTGLPQLTTIDGCDGHGCC